MNIHIVSASFMIHYVLIPLFQSVREMNGADEIIYTMTIGGYLRFVLNGI